MYVFWFDNTSLIGFGVDSVFWLAINKLHLFTYFIPIHIIKVMIFHCEGQSRW